MGIQLKSGVIYGKVGSVVFRRWRGMNVVQGLPRKVQQSVPTKAAAAEFGLASSSAADLRNFLHPLYKQDDLSMKNRLTRQVLKSIQHSSGKERLDRDLHDADLSHLQNFQFNEHCSLQEALGVHPVVQISAQGKAHIAIPPCSAAAITYKGESSVVHGFRLRIVAVGLDFRRRKMEVLEMLDIDLKDDMGALSFDLCGPQAVGTIVLVGIALYAEQRFGEELLLLNTRSWSPACILGMGHVAEEEADIAESSSEGDAIGFRGPAPGCSKFSIPGYLKDAYWAMLERASPLPKETAFVLEKGAIMQRG